MSYNSARKSPDLPPSSLSAFHSMPTAWSSTTGELSRAKCSATICFSLLLSLVILVSNEAHKEGWLGQAGHSDTQGWTRAPSHCSELITGSHGGDLMVCPLWQEERAPNTAAMCSLTGRFPLSLHSAEVFVTLTLLLLWEALLGPLNRHSPGRSVLYTRLVAGISYCVRPSLRAHRTGEVPCICAHSCKNQL